MQLKHIHKKSFAVYGEGAVTDRSVKSAVQSFVLGTSCWMMLHSQVEQLKLIAIKLRH